VLNPSAVASEDVRVISAYFDGNVRKALVENQEGSTTGFVGLNIQYPISSWSLFWAAAASAAPLEESFGSSILNTANRGALSGFGIDVRLLPATVDQFLVGGRLYMQSSIHRWTVDATTYDVTSNAAALLGTIEYRDSLGEDNPLTVNADLGVAMRGLGGEIARKSLATVRDSVLGSAKTEWIGLQIGLTAQLGYISASASYYHFPGSVPGLSGGLSVVMLSVRPPLFSHKRSWSPPTTVDSQVSQP